MRVKRASKYGFCAGVRVADTTLRRFASGGSRASILGALVHNERVVAEMETLGMQTVDDLAEVTNPTVVFSAHGVPPSCHDRAREMGLEVLDTTCAFVKDIHDEIEDALAGGFHLVVIGEPEHREVVGYTGDLDAADFHVITDLDDVEAVGWGGFTKIKVIFQTTLNAGDFEPVVRAIEQSNPRTFRADTICYATRENQDAAQELGDDPTVDVIVVVGGRNSANTEHLWEICKRRKPSYWIQGVEDIREEWFEEMSCVGLTAGASTPDSIIDEVEKFLLTLAS